MSYNIHAVKNLVEFGACAFCNKRPGKLYVGINFNGTFFRCDHPGCQPGAIIKEITLEEYEVIMTMDE